MVAASGPTKDKNKGGSGWLLYEIADCARMCFSSVRNRRSARTDLPSVRVLAIPARYARQPCFPRGWKAHPRGKHGSG